MSAKMQFIFCGQINQLLDHALINHPDVALLNCGTILNQFSKVTDLNPSPGSATPQMFYTLQ
ncbi:MAG: hypothetical protein MJA27_04225 [Pseudanabaenales cyanobacterium]|nr:hypothetical protein [Pseudanabaenales cyanobacterium]